MPRPVSIDPLREALQTLGRQLGEELASAITSELSRNVAVPRKRGEPTARRGAASVRAGGESCRVPGCRRDAASKGLCSAHYQKAYRLKLDAGALSAADLQLLGQDGRALRWKA